MIIIIFYNAIINILIFFNINVIFFNINVTIHTTNSKTDNEYNYSVNKLAELSAVPPTTLRSLLANNVDNPSATVIFKICKTLNIELKNFFDRPYFDNNKLDY